MSNPVSKNKVKINKGRQSVSTSSLHMYLLYVPKTHTYIISLLMSYLLLLLLLVLKLPSFIKRVFSGSIQPIP